MARHENPGQNLGYLALCENKFRQFILNSIRTVITIHQPIIECTKDSGTLPLDVIRLNVKPRPEESSEEQITMEMPIVLPHLLAGWLLQKHRLSFSASKRLEFWQHHRRQATPLGTGLQCSGSLVEPIGLYSDEAEYTVSKEKILVIMCSTVAQYCNFFTYI